MMEIKNQRFDIKVAPSGQPLDETKKGLMTLKIKFVPSAPAEAAPAKVEEAPKEVPKEAPKEEIKELPKEAPK